MNDSRIQAPDPSLKPWWGSLKLDPGQGVAWRIGPLSLWIARSDAEWTIATHSHIQQPLDNTLILDAPEDPAPSPPPEAEMARFVGLGEVSALWLSPACADRAIVVRPETPLRLLPNTSVSLYMSTPLWIQVRINDARGALLGAIPLYRLSDTWFGPDTTQGALCYASLTLAKLNATDVPRRPGRALTQVTMHNMSDDPLAVERLKLPLPYMALFHDPHDERVWTQSLAVERRHQTPMVDLRLQSGPPTPIKRDAKALAGPRKQEGWRSLTSALSALMPRQGGIWGG